MAKVKRLGLEVKRLPNQLSVSILDNGMGFDPEVWRDVSEHRASQVSLGLASMTERAKLLGGTLEIKSAKGSGTRLDLTIPLEQLRTGSKQVYPIATEPRPRPLGSASAS